MLAPPPPVASLQRGRRAMGWLRRGDVHSRGIGGEEGGEVFDLTDDDSDR